MDSIGVTIKIVGGDVELFNNNELLYDDTFMHSHSYKYFLFKNYRGAIGLNDSVIGIYGNTAVRGFVGYPAYIRTKGVVDITVPSDIKLIVRSWVDGGMVDDTPLKRGTPFFSYGRTFTSYAEEYFRPKIPNRFFKYSDITSDSENFYSDHNKQLSISFLELCKKNNLIFIESEERAPKITVALSLEEILSANILRLFELRNHYTDTQQYEFADVVKKQIYQRMNSDK
jgi:DNA-binding XRE family transcriptional regulator